MKKILCIAIISLCVNTVHADVEPGDIYIDGYFYGVIKTWAYTVPYSCQIPNNPDPPYSQGFIDGQKDAAICGMAHCEDDYANYTIWIENTPLNQGFWRNYNDYKDELWTTHPDGPEIQDDYLAGLHDGQCAMYYMISLEEVPE